METQPATQSSPPASPQADALQHVLDLLSADRPGFATTEFYVAVVALIAIYTAAIAGVLPSAWAGAATLIAPSLYQWLRNTRKNDNESSLLSLAETIKAAGPLLNSIPTSNESGPQAVLAPGPIVQPSPAPVASPASTVSGNGGQASPVSARGNAASELLGVVAAFGLVALIVGCGTPFGIGLGNALGSPVGKAIESAVISAGVSFGLNSLEANGNVPPGAQSQINSAVSSAVSSVGVNGLDWIASALRGQQGTSTACSAPAIAGTLTAGTLPPAAATAIGNSVQALWAKGVNADTANEAIAAALNAAAAAGRSPGTSTPAPATSKLRWDNDGWQRSGPDGRSARTLPILESPSGEIILPDGSKLVTRAGN